VLNLLFNHGDVSTLPTVELGVLGPLQVRQDGGPVTIPGAKPRAILTMLGLHCSSVVSADTLVELLWGDDPPRTAGKALQTHISSLRHALGDGFVLTEGTGWTVSTNQIDASRYKLAARFGREAAAAGDISGAVARFEEALALWRGIPELPDSQRGLSEKTRWIEAHAALLEDRADALLATGRAAEIIGELEAAVADAPLRERRWGQLMLALYRAGRQGEALGAYQRARSLLAEELGVDPGPDLRRLEAAIVAQDAALDTPVSQHIPSVTRAVTFLLTDIEGSTAAWEAEADAMGVALARHDELVEQVVTSRGGRLIKTRGEGDATFSVFERPSAAAAAAIELQDAMYHEPWTLHEPMRIRVALHTGEVELRDGDYFGRAVNRAARLRSLAAGGQILCSGATAELVIDSLSDDVVLADLGMRQLRNLARPEHVFELRMETAQDRPEAPPTDAPIERPALPAVLTGRGPFVGRGRELERLLSAWQTTLAGGMHAVLIAGEPGVGKTRLAGEWSRHAYGEGAVVLYGRCDEDLGAPYQPFAEAMRSLMPCLGARRLRELRGVEALLPLVPGLPDVLPDLAAPPRADPDTERYALFDAVVALLGVASVEAPVVLILDDLHWAAKPTLLLMRHLLRFGEHARVHIIGTYRSTDLDRSHPLAAMLADLHRDSAANRIQLSGLDEEDVTAYVAEAGYEDEELARALASVTGGNPFFLIEALRHVEESGGHWDPSTLPQGVREAVSRRLSRLPAETNKALAAAAVVGSRFAVDLVERVVGEDLVDAFDEACKAGIIIEEPGGRYRFNHAIVRQSLLAELASMRRMRLHQRIATTLEAEPGADDELLAELAHHYFECAWAGNAAKAVQYCRRAAHQAMARLAYEGAADLYDRALHALEELDEELPDRDDQQAELLVARCEALLAAGDVVSAAGAVSQLQEATHDSARLAAWGTCFDGQLSMLTDPERLDEVEAALSAAADRLAGLDDAAGEAKAHTVRAGCLARLGRVADCEVALDHALTAARRSRDHRRVNAVLAGAPLAALWGPNPVPRAGGRCLDVVRLLRITTDSPAVEATSTRCQAVLEAFRGRAAAAQRMIDSARRTVTELGLRHALLEVEQFAGIVELVADDPAAAEPHLRKAYNGFRRMGLDADTAETAALLSRACLALDKDVEADELCSASQRLAGHALKPAIAWRTVRAQLLARRGAHDDAKRVAEEAVMLAERTDILVDHGDACLALATVLGAADDAAGARAAAERAVGLYELKGAAALAEKARRVLGECVQPTARAAAEAPTTELDNACVRVLGQIEAAFYRKAWDEYEALYAPDVFVESRRKIVGFTHGDLPSGDWPREARRLTEMSQGVRQVVVAVRGERLALSRLEIGTEDLSPGAPQDEFLQLYGIDEDGRMALQVFFDIEDLDAAIAQLDALHARSEREHPRAPLENAATRVADQVNELFSGSRWDEIGALVADGIHVDDRRRGIGRVGNDCATEVANVSALADMGVAKITTTPLALRGNRLCLSDVRFQGRDTRPDAFNTETLSITEVDRDGLIVAMIAFDPNEFDAAIAELDARYLAGEAAAYSSTWSVVTAGNAALNRHELPPSTPDFVNIDHRRGTAFAPGELIPYVRAGWDLDQNIRTYIETVHRVSDLGAVFSWAGHGTSQEGFAADWRGVNLVTVDGEMVNRAEVFEEADVDAAIAKFDQLSRPAMGLENAASRAYERFKTCFAARDWDTMTELFDDNVSTDDRRRVVNAGRGRGPKTLIAEMSAIAGVGVKNITTDVIATRGARLVLSHARAVRGEQRPDAFRSDVLDVIEIDADEKFVARVVFDPDDFDAAFEELDARYLAGEAAPHAHTWSLVAGAYAALNRRELPTTTADQVSIDHRRVTAFAPGEIKDYTRSAWKQIPDLSFRIEAVHQLSDLGAVITHALCGTSQEGFEAEWREIHLMTVESELFSRSEMYDESDLDAAIAKFEHLSRTTPRLENAASQAADRLLERFAARDWDAIADLFADDFSSVDRRRVLGAGIRHGRDVEIASIRAGFDLGGTNWTSPVIATRGERLILTRTGYTGQNKAPEPFRVDVLGVVEIDADERIVTRIVFDPDDIDAAYKELDARYLAGEAAPYAQTWQKVRDGLDAVNRHELPPMTWGEVAFADHRRVPFVPEDFARGMTELWELVPDARYRTKAVHALDSHGAVARLVIEGTDVHGNELQWARTTLVAFTPGHAKLEVYEEDDLDAALTRFEELRPQTRRLENAACRADDRLHACFAASDWDAMAETIAQDIVYDDRRRVVNAGFRRGRDAEIVNSRALADLGAKVTSTVVATRGERLVLTRSRFTGPDQGPDAFHNVMLSVLEIDADERVMARVVFDPQDIDVALAELDARYLAGEAAVHADMWSVIAHAYAALNRHELPTTTSDWLTIDHRVRERFVEDDLTAYIRSGWDVAPDVKIYIEAVHRLSNLGAVVTHVAYGTSPDGFDAEWRIVELLAVGGDRTNRCELFDEAGLDTALARFEELSRPVPRLENPASRQDKRVCRLFATRDWDAIAETMVADIAMDDRRRVVSAGIRHGRDLEIANLRALADIGITKITSAVVATRGDSLAVVRNHVSDRWSESGESTALCVVEVNPDNRIGARIVFDPDDIDAAVEELDARYLVCEAAAYSQTWSAISGVYASFNRHELPATTPDWITIDHRPLATFEFRDAAEFFRATWDLTPQTSIYVEAVHRLNNLGGVLTHAVYGTSQDRFDAEWRQVAVITAEGSQVNRCEIFDEADIDAALARFDELNRPAPTLKNAASQIGERFYADYRTRNWTAMAEMLAHNSLFDDRRRVVNAGVWRGRDAVIANFQVLAEVGANIALIVIATRGERLALSRFCASNRDLQPGEFGFELLNIVEINADNQIGVHIAFDPNNIDTAFEELDTRYLAGEAAAYAHTWSVITRAYGAFNRREMFPTTPDWVNIDHRRGTPLAAANDITAAIRAFWDLTPDFNMHVAAVHRLSEFGAVVTHTSHGTSPDGFDAEWRMVQLLTVDRDRINRCEIFDETDLDAALARFEELNPSAPRLENTASQVYERFWTCFAARDWTAMAEIVAADLSTDDRRRVVNEGIRHGRDAAIASMRVLADVGVTSATSTVIATRGKRLALSRVGSSAFQTEVVNLVEIDADERIAAVVGFDGDDIRAAFEELDARYVAGEAAAHEHTWSLIARTYAAFNRRELPTTTPDFVDIDNRRLATIETGALIANVRAGWDLWPEVGMYVETVHRLSNLGAVVTHAGHATSQGDFDAEWRAVDIVTVENDLINRYEQFDDADLDAALARFDELNLPAPQLENAATRAQAHLADSFNRRDLDGFLAFGAVDGRYEDRRKGLRAEGPLRPEVARALCEAPKSWRLEIESVAIRGNRLALTRGRYRDINNADRPITAEALALTEVDDDELVCYTVHFDPDDVDAAFAELEARYLAGEAAAHAQTWSVIANACAAFNRREMFPTTPDWANIDHRRAVGFATGDMTAYIGATWDVAPDVKNCIEVVHRLSGLGALVTHTTKGTSKDGFGAEWREIGILTVEGDLITRIETFDEADLDAALARFDELDQQVPQVENAATRTWMQIVDAINRRDADDFLALASADGRLEDRRKGLHASHEGPERRRAAQAMCRAPESWHMEVEPVAIRGSHLGLTRERWRDTDEADAPITVESLTLTEVTGDELAHYTVVFDPDDINGAIAELTARWVASGEVAHPEIIESVDRLTEAVNRHDWDAIAAHFAGATFISHRQLATEAADTIADWLSSMRTIGSLVPDFWVEHTAVLARSAIGIVSRMVVKGTSTGGAGIEIPFVFLILLDGDRFSHFEAFDEDQRDLALARFQELGQA
jgi:DNA-binding SARP family transcriptional activator